MSGRKKIHLVAGARPNFVKIAPLYRVLSQDSALEVALIHTGQHYDFELNQSIWNDLELPKPDYFLEVGGVSPSLQTAAILERYSKILHEDRPDLVIVVGDVTSTFAACLTAKNAGVLVAHLEAGLRSFDRAMPEEINRVLTDAIADFLWTPSEDGNKNLIIEGKSLRQMALVGNIMIDSRCLFADKIDRDPVLEHLHLKSGEFAVMTLHRPSNVDDDARLKEIVTVAQKLAEACPIVFPVHPRTEKKLQCLKNTTGIVFTKPFGYLAFSKLVSEARYVVTDSGGVQEETSFLGIPCFTLRENTERPVTLTLGTNQLVSLDQLTQKVSELSKERKKTAIPFWDGKTASRAHQEIYRVLGISK